MSNEALAIIGGFLSGIGAMVVAIYTAMTSASHKELEALQKENNRLRDRLDELEKENDELREDLRKVRSWARSLTKQVEKLGGEPCPYPEKSVH
jgi:predicted nuclease with TOPRIM domain